MNYRNRLSNNQQGYNSSSWDRDSGAPQRYSGRQNFEDSDKYESDRDGYRSSGESEFSSTGGRPQQYSGRGENQWSYPNSATATGQHAGKGPKGYQRSDERIREDVSEALTRHGEIDPSDVEITVKDGIVTLSGTVENRQAKRMLESTIENLSGVQDIRNEVRVQASSDLSRNSFAGSQKSAPLSKGRVTQ